MTTITVADGVKERQVEAMFTYPLPGPAHCNLANDGRWTFWSPGDGFQECPDWRDHPESRGKTGFLRFIHALPDQLDGSMPNPFISGHYEREDEEDQDVILWICHEGQVTPGGRLMYAEVYLLDDERGVNPTFKVFLDREVQLAHVVCYDERYREAATMAAAAVRQSYIDEVEAADAQA